VGISHGSQQGDLPVEKILQQQVSGQQWPDAALLPCPSSPFARRTSNAKNRPSRKRAFRSRRRREENTCRR